jgi:hypothetical protein
MGKAGQAGKVGKVAKAAKMGKTMNNKKNGSSREHMLQMDISADLDNKDIKARRAKMGKLNTSFKILMAPKAHILLHLS